MCRFGDWCVVLDTGPSGPSGPQPRRAEARCSFLSQTCPAGCCAQKGAIQNSKFKIQNYEIGLQAAERTLEADFRDASCGPPCGPHGLINCGPPISAASIPLVASPSPEAAADCRSLCDRFCQQTFSPDPAAAGCQTCAFGRPSAMRSQAALRNAPPSRSGKARFFEENTTIRSVRGDNFDKNRYLWLRLRYFASAKCK